MNGNVEEPKKSDDVELSSIEIKTDNVTQFQSQPQRKPEPQFVQNSSPVQQKWQSQQGHKTLNSYQPMNAPNNPGNKTGKVNAIKDTFDKKPEAPTKKVSNRVSVAPVEDEMYEEFDS